MTTTTKYSIMVVEDEELLLQAITKKLKLNKIEPISCATGKQAFDYLTNLTSLPDAIWLDYHLTDMNGIKFMDKLRQNSKWSKIPVLVISNSAGDDKVHSMLALGVKKYLVKAEHRLDDLIKEIITFIKLEKK